eukprot:7992871-Prorocentrum_lima.AAC.1
MEQQLPQTASDLPRNSRSNGYQSTRNLRVISGFSDTHRNEAIEYLNALPGPRIRNIRPLALHPKMAMLEYY